MPAAEAFNLGKASAWDAYANTVIGLRETFTNSVASEETAWTGAVVAASTAYSQTVEPAVTTFWDSITDAETNWFTSFVGSLTTAIKDTADEWKTLADTATSAGKTWEDDTSTAANSAVKSTVDQLAQTSTSLINNDRSAIASLITESATLARTIVGEQSTLKSKWDTQCYLTAHCNLSYCDVRQSELHSEVDHDGGSGSVGGCVGNSLVSRYFESGQGGFLAW